MTTKSLKFIDLFCGIGGFHQALKQHGCECVMACDIDKNCRHTYKENYNIECESDVKKIDIDAIPDFDILCGGFPCQSFSNAGNKQTFNDERGLLFDEIIKIAVKKTPKYMFLENVKHILKVDDGNVFKYIMDKLDATNYNVKVYQISPHSFGIPQQRERVYFACIRKDINKPLPELTYNKVGIKFTDFLDKEVDAKYKISQDIEKVLEAWEEMVKIFDVGEKISPTIMVNEFYKTYTPDEFSKLAKWRQDYITKNKPLYAKYKDKWDIWYKKHAEILGKREIYAKLEWQVGKIKDNDSIFNYFIQFRQSGIRVKKAEYFPTLVAISQIPIYGKERRYITPRECARLQSFPEDFKLDPSDRISYKQLGNSVNVHNVNTIISMVL
jgi:DNA (cytosine-5)-methyltransferase 1